jgi:ethanolamine utilization protein EutQ (cupin superfamily)
LHFLEFVKAGLGIAPVPYGRGSGGRTDALVAEVVRRVSEQEPVRIPREVLEELESVRRYTRVEVLDIPAVRHVAMERGKPALVVWIDKYEQEYGLGLLNGFLAEH